MPAAPADVPTARAGPSVRRHAYAHLALSTGVFLYIWLRLDPSLLFDAVARFLAFTPGWPAAFRMLAHPGGPGEHLSAWLAQWFYLSWPAALLLAALIAAVCLGLRRYLEALVGKPIGWVVLLPGTLALVMLNQFEYHLPDLLGVAAATGGAALYVARRTARPGPRAGWFLGLSLALYALFGAPYLLFALLCAVSEMVAGGHRLLGLLYLLSAEALPQALGVWWLRLEPGSAFTLNTPLDDSYSLIARLTLGLLWLGIFLIAVAAARRGVAPGAPGSPSWPPGRAGLRAAAIVAALALPVLLTYHSRGRIVLQTDRALREGRDAEVLRLVRRARFSPPSPLLVYATNTALSHLGRLPHDMFKYPQTPAGALLGMMGAPDLDVAQLRNARYIPPGAFQCSEALLNFGLVNQAEHEASQSLEVNGPHPRILKVLAQAHLAKGQTQAARTFLLALARSPGGRVWAQQKLAGLAADPAQARDPGVCRLRRIMLTEDVGAPDIALEEQCQALLRRDPTNRRAFEMLMAYYLLNRDLEGFASNIERLSQLGYSEVPRPWQEALVLRQVKTGKTVGLSGYRLGSEVFAAFNSFSGLVRPPQQRGDAAGARRAADAEFGNSYFYYYVFGESGVGQP